MLISVDNFLILAEEEIAKKTKELVKQFHHSVPSLCLADDVELLAEIVDKVLLAKQEEAQVLMSWAMGYYNLIEAPTRAFESVQGLTFEIGNGDGGSGVTDHSLLTGVEILTATTIPTGNKAWHLDGVVAGKLLESLYGVVEPELPEGVFWVRRPQGSFLLNGIYTEGESTINAYGAEAVIDPHEFPITYASNGRKRFDAIVINLTTFIYEYVTGPEFDENGIVIYATIPEDTMFVRYLEINDNIVTIPAGTVKGITINTPEPVLLPNNNGIVNLPVVHVNRIQVDMAVDNTGTYIPTVDAVNNLTNTISRAVLGIGFIDTQDSFILSKVDDSHLGVGASEFGIVFPNYFTVPPYAPEEGIKFLADKTIPLADAGALVTSGTIAILYVGWREADDTIVFDTVSFVQNREICQLGLVFVKNTAGAYSFVDADRTLITIPDVAAYSNLATTAIGIKSNVVIRPNTSGMLVKNIEGVVQGVSVNWHGANNDERPISAANPTSFTILSPANLNGLSLPAPTTTVVTTLYYNGIGNVTISAPNKATVMRWLLTIEGKFILQLGETEYANFTEAKDNVFIQNFTNILPKGSFVEIGRLVTTRSTTNLADNAQAVFYTTGAGGGGGGVAQEPSDWNATTGVTRILNKPTIPTQYTDAMAIAAALSAPLPVLDITTSRTLALTDLGQLLNVKATGTCTITIPNDSAVNFPIGSQIPLDWGDDVGQPVISNASGVTIQSAGNKYKVTEKFAGIIIHKIKANTWRLKGALSL